MKDETQDPKVISSPISRPVRTKRPARFASSFAEGLMPYFPDLKKKLYLAGMPDTPSEFLEKAVSSAVILSIGFSLLLAVFFNMIKVNFLFAILLFPFVLAGMFMYMMFYPAAMTIKRQRDIDSELVFAGRHILIALKAGMPLFDSLVGVSSGYGAVSQEFRRIVEKINLGVPMGHALRESGSNSPSPSFARIVIQLSNALSSGADVSSSLEAVLSQIAREQAISLKAYGQKLNPMIMFYMIVGIIFPSLGVAFVIILFSIVSSGSIGINSTSLIYVTLLIAIIQITFLSLVESSRPRYLL